MTRKTFLLGCVSLFVGNRSAFPDDNEHEDDEHEDDDDHEAARRALQVGEAKPLSEIVDVVETQFDGEIVGVEFEHKDGRYAYEFKIITQRGELREIYVDAKTAEILAVERD